MGSHGRGHQSRAGISWRLRARGEAHELLGELDTNTITDGLSFYEDFGDEFMSVLSEVEDQLIDLGIIESGKLFANPDS